MNISVIIPVFNEEKYIEECLKSILHQTQHADEIIVVDNNCTDGTIALVKQFPQVRIVKETTQGMIPARNKGFNAARFEIIARTDADTRVSKNWIAKIKRDFEKNPDVVALSGRAVFFSDISYLRKKVYLQGEKVYFGIFHQVYHYPCLVGPNMAIKKQAWQKIKDEVCLEDSIVHEDADLTIHIAQLGTVLFDKKLIVLSSSRRWRRFRTHIEYPYRYLRTLQHHKRSLHAIKMKTEMVRKALPKPRRILKRIRSSASASLRLAKILTE